MNFAHFLGRKLTEVGPRTYFQYQIGILFALAKQTIGIWYVFAWFLNKYIFLAVISILQQDYKHTTKNLI